MTAEDIVKDRGEAFQRRLQPLDYYQRKGWISQAQAVAGDVLYWAWVVGVMGANPEPNEMPFEVRASFGPRDIPIEKLGAVRRYRGAMKLLGKRLSWVGRVCCEGVMVAEIAEGMGLGSKRGVSEMMTLLRHALDTLGDYWEESP